MPDEADSTAAAYEHIPLLQDDQLTNRSAGHRLIRSGITGREDLTSSRPQSQYYVPFMPTFDNGDTSSRPLGVTHRSPLSATYRARRRARENGSSSRSMERERQTLDAISESTSLRNLCPIQGVPYTYNVYLRACLSRVGLSPGNLFDTSGGDHSLVLRLVFAGDRHYGPGKPLISPDEVGKAHPFWALPVKAVVDKALEEAAELERHHRFGPLTHRNSQRLQIGFRDMEVREDNRRMDLSSRLHGPPIISEEEFFNCPLLPPPYEEEAPPEYGQDWQPPTYSESDPLDNLQMELAWCIYGGTGLIELININRNIQTLENIDASEPSLRPANHMPIDIEEYRECYLSRELGLFFRQMIHKNTMKRMFTDRERRTILDFLIEKRKLYRYYLVRPALGKHLIRAEELRIPECLWQRARQTIPEV